MADETTTLTDEEIVTRVDGPQAVADSGDDSGDVADTGESGDTGDDSGDVADTGDTGDIADTSGDGGAAA